MYFSFKNTNIRQSLILFLHVFFYSENIVLKSNLKKKLSQAILTVNIVKIYTHRVQQVFHQSVENVSVCSKLGGLYCFLMCPLLKRKKKLSLPYHVHDISQKRATTYPVLYTLLPKWTPVPPCNYYPKSLHNLMDL